MIDLDVLADGYVVELCVERFQQFEIQPTVVVNVGDLWLALKGEYPVLLLLFL